MNETCIKPGLEDGLINMPINEFTYFRVALMSPNIRDAR
jgi:hypothetical protein